MTRSARVVVIGGGIMGTSLLYHLAREGWTDTVLLEKGELTSGSTWHAAGQVTHGLAHRALGKMNAYGVRLYRRLEAETGQSVSWHGCGSCAWPTSTTRSISSATPSPWGAAKASRWS